MRRTTATISIPISAELAVALSPLSREARGLFLELAMMSLARSSTLGPPAPPAGIVQSSAWDSLVGSGVVALGTDGSLKLPHIEQVIRDRGRAAARMARSRNMRATSAQRCANVTASPPTTPPQDQNQKTKDTPPTPRRAGGVRERDLPAWADQVWAVCGWRRVGRLAALRAIAQAGARLAAERFGGDVEAARAFLVNKAKAYSESRYVQTCPTRYRPHPSTWFNGGRYDDDPAEWARGYGDDKAGPAPDSPEVLARKRAARERLGAIGPEQLAALMAEWQSTLTPGRVSFYRANAPERRRAFEAWYAEKTAEQEAA